MSGMFRDPVTGFSYPAAWIEACRDPAGLAMAREGLAVLSADGTVLRRGYTTGTTAAACCKAAILSLGKDLREVEIGIPAGLRVIVDVDASGGRASCRKYAGDYPDDVTAGLEFRATCTPLECGLMLSPGRGIGRFSRETPRFGLGEPAISRPALECITAAMEEACEIAGLGGASVTLEIPDGEEVARRTLNPKVGVAGGLSILGTTGLVEPWDDHLGQSVVERVKTEPRVVLATGRTGLFFARLLFPDHTAVLAGSRIREALLAAKGDVILCGLPGLVLKFLYPGVLDDTGYETVGEMEGSPIFFERVREAFQRGKMQYPDLRVVIIDRLGTVLGDSG